LRGTSTEEEMQHKVPSYNCWIANLAELGAERPQHEMVVGTGTQQMGGLTSSKLELAEGGRRLSSLPFRRLSTPLRRIRVAGFRWLLDRAHLLLADCCKSLDNLTAGDIMS